MSDSFSFGFSGEDIDEEVAGGKTTFNQDVAPIDIAPRPLRFVDPRAHTLQELVSIISSASFYFFTSLVVIDYALFTLYCKL